jgi:hypothetical protein
MATPKLMFTRRPAHKAGEVGLFPTEPWADERMSSYPMNASLGVTITNFKRAGKMGWYWGGLALLLENLDEASQLQWPTTRKLHNMLMEELGHTEKIYRIDGSFRVVPDSIAIDNMDDPTFEAFFERVRAFMVEHWGDDPWQMWMDERRPNGNSNRTKK